jgi:selenocysteine lyase/cysteine desulfurase
LAFKDAIFFSGHKFIGGPQTPGVLIAKQKLFKNKIPHQCGGGTVHYVKISIFKIKSKRNFKKSIFKVAKTKHCYLEDNEEREEGGTPAIIESIRLGLVFQLKEALDEDNVRKREQFLVK